MVRFGVRQKVQPCDNARAFGHNAETRLTEKLLCDHPDFSAWVAVRGGFLAAGTDAGRAHVAARGRH
eukprot:125004-Prymnesium_polylepis.1